MRNNNIIKKREKRYFFILISLLFAVNIQAQNPTDIPAENIRRDSLLATPYMSRHSFQIDTVFANRVHKENFKLIPSKVNIYDMPYSMTANYPNYKRLGLNTGVLFGAGVAALGVLQLLPEDATSWNKKEIIDVPPFRRWANNVKKGPVWDNDNAIFNYVLHPYGGAAYYMSARSQGFNVLYSFLYGAGISTIFWEYGIEAFMEVPSIQDLIITPTAGFILGEGFYLLKRHIVSNGYKLFGSSIIGNVVAYIIDPVNEVIGIFAGNPNRQKQKQNAARTSLACRPWLTTSNSGTTFGYTISLSF